MADQMRRRLAVEWTVERLAQAGSLYMWTLTTPDEVHDPAEISKRWNHFLTIARKHGRSPARGVRVYERHPRGHGIHVHCLCTAYWHVREVRDWARAAGFGRVHVVKVGEDASRYVTKYFRKGLDDFAGSGVRVYSFFGLRGVATRQRDIECVSPKTIIYAGLAAAIAGFALMPFYCRMEALDKAHFAWLASEAREPSEWCAVNLVPSSAFQRPPFDAEQAQARAEIRAWDRGMKKAGREVARVENFVQWNESAPKWWQKET